MELDDKPAKTDEDILKESRDRFQISAEADREIRELALEDLKFRAGDQWDSKVKNIRELDQRPCLTINRLPQFVRQITNDQRQNRPAVAVAPVDGGADPETAQIFQGIIRHIEQDSNADAAYDTAFQAAVTGGFGYWRIVTEYCTPKSFDQDIKIKRIRNPFSVYLDPSRTEADGCDIRFAHVVEDMTIEEYKAKWPKSKLANMGDWMSVGDNMMDWVTANGCRVAEYYRIVDKPRKLVKLSDGTIAWKDELPPNLPLGVTIAAERDSSDQKVEWFIHNGIEILDRTDWLGRYIPIVPVFGDEMDVDGKLILEGIIRHAKDPMRMYNYWASAETELIALAPKAPFIGAEGQFEGREEKWQQANVKNYAYLEYKPKTVAGEVMPPPQRNVAEPPVAAITQARAQASDDLKATTGIYDAALGARSNERSGRAITARNVQAQTSNFHFIDNLGRAIKFTGRILVDLIPKIYDAPRVMRIIGEDGEISQVSINGPQGPQQEGGAVERIYDLNAGRYDVVTRAGPSFATKRQQAVESMLDLAQSAPGIVQLAGDLLVKNMDWPGALEISQRLKKGLPPGIAEPEPGQGGKPLPLEVQQQLQQMDQMVQQLTEALNAAKDELDSNQQELASKERIAAADRDSEERIAFAKIKAEMAAAAAKLNSEEAQHALTVQIDQMMKDAELQHTANKENGDSSAELISTLENVLKKVEELSTRQPEIHVNMPAKGATVKTGRAIPQSDGSFLMESTEQPAGVE